ncbi:MAG TPA: DUF6266 family protein [Pedobacter sp.]|nr:DUF6266 family protein [Pedobacter sp.]
MGIQLWGAFGGFRKKTGALVGKWLNGQNVISAIPHPSEKAPSVGQLNARAKFKLLVTWLSWVSPVVRVGFQNAREEKQSGFNAAFAYNYQNAISGVGPAYVIDYDEVLLAKGRLSNGYNLAMATTEDAQLDFSWTAYVANGLGAPTDLATVVVYNPVKAEFTVAVGAAPRSALSFDMSVPSMWSGDTVYPWVFFVSADGKLNSDSKFQGSVVVQ